MTDQSPSQAATLTPEVRKDLKAKALKATPGRWLVCPEGDNGGLSLIRASHAIQGMVIATTWAGKRTRRDTNEANAAFIAAANPSTILAYEAALEEAEGRADFAEEDARLLHETHTKNGDALHDRLKTAEQALSAQQQENERLRTALKGLRGWMPMSGLTPECDDAMRAADIALQAPQGQGGEA